MTALWGRALGTWKVTSGALQVQAIAQIVRRSYVDTLLVVQVLPVAVIQSAIQLTFLSLAALRIEVSKKLFA